MARSCAPATKFVSNTMYTILIPIFCVPATKYVGVLMPTDQGSVIPYPMYLAVFGVKANVYWPWLGHALSCVPSNWCLDNLRFTKCFYKMAASMT